MSRKDDNAIFVNGNTGETIVGDIISQAGLKMYHNLYLKDSKGYVCQIDFLVLTQSVAISIEVKTYSGCVIKGDEHNPYWTACYRSGNKTILNPVTQNKKHVNVVKDITGGRIPIWNVVVFADGCSIRTERMESDMISLINISDLWYLLTDVQYSSGKISTDVYKDILCVLDGFRVRASELYEEHQKAHFNKGKK